MQLRPLEGNEVTLFRLARAEYANLSGIGAALYPGRWNRAGQQAIYTSVEQSVPVLEKLVHTSKRSIPRNLAMMELRLVLPAMHDSQITRARSLKEARDVFRAGISQDVIAFAVPSVIVPVWNVVLYPEAKGFWDHVFLKNVVPFEFDPRLFPDA